MEGTPAYFGEQKAVGNGEGLLVTALCIHQPLQLQLGIGPCQQDLGEIDLIADRCRQSFGFGKMSKRLFGSAEAQETLAEVSEIVGHGPARADLFVDGERAFQGFQRRGRVS
jgi:hypothetical protein